MRVPVLPSRMLIALTLALFPLSAAAGTASRADAVAIAKLPAWARPFARGAMEPMPNVAAFNLALTDSARTATWPRHASLVALHFAGLLDDDTPGVMLVIDAPGEAARECVARVTRDGFLDDSERGDYTLMRLTRGADRVWRVEEGFHAWRCQKGRGQQEYGIEPCW